MVIVAVVFFAAILVLTGFNAYVTFAAPERQVEIANQPTTIGFQGYLEENGSPVTGTKSITFTLYDASTGGTSIWSETQGSVSVEDGLYSVQLGSSTALDPDDFGDERWLGVTVQGDSEMTPRIPISAVPWAYNARQAMGLQGQPVSTAVPQSGDLLSYDGTEWGPISNGAQDGGTKTIVDGAISVDGGYIYQLNAEFGDPSDILTTINGTQEGEFIYLLPDAGDSVILEDGTGNIDIEYGWDVPLSTDHPTLLQNVNGTTLKVINPLLPRVEGEWTGIDNAVSLTSSYTAIFGTEVTDTHDMLTPSSTTITVPYDGMYAIDWWVKWRNDNSTDTWFKGYLNISSYPGREFAIDTETNYNDNKFTWQGSAVVVPLSAGDTLTLQVDETQGGRVRIDSGTTVRIHISMVGEPGM